MNQFIIRLTLLTGLSFCLFACGSDSKNKSPTLSIEGPTTIDELATVSLTAKALDSDGEITAYHWQQTSGITVLTDHNNSHELQFTAPEVNKNETLIFSLMVKDNEGATVTKTLSLQVVNINKLPIVSINGPNSADELSLLTLNADIDDDGTIAHITWKQTSGTTIIIEDTASEILTFTLPNITADEVVTFSLVVIDNDGGVTNEEISIEVNALTLAQTSNISQEDIVENDKKPSLFISGLDLNINEELLSHIGFTIKAKPGSLAAQIKANYAIDKLSTHTQGIHLPVYGLYRSHANEVELAFTFTDNSVKTMTTEIITEADLEPVNNPFNKYVITEPVSSTNKPSYDYLLMKSSTNGPVIMDIDGNVRWQSYLTDGELYSGRSTLFKDGSFIVANDDELYTVHLDGTFSSAKISHEDLSDIEAHHELSLGKSGYLVEIDTNKTGYSERLIESILVEVNDQGKVIKQWDFSEIVAKYMLANGDDPVHFVRNGIDWFHMNSAIYQQEDNSLLVSSRENFVIKIDYDTQEIKWILGDETKHWFVNFPSLRTLSLYSSDTKPIGQHALSIVDGELLLFNDGQLSFNQPEDAPKGLALTTSPSARYEINEETMTASVTWSYDSSIYSDVCSSIYIDETKSNGDYLVNFAAVNRLNAEPVTTVIQGINEDKSLLFEFKFETQKPCFAAWNSSIVNGLDALTIN